MYPPLIIVKVNPSWSISNNNTALINHLLSVCPSEVNSVPACPTMSYMGHLMPSRFLHFCPRAIICSYDISSDVHCHAPQGSLNIYCVLLYLASSKVQWLGNTIKVIECRSPLSSSECYVCSCLHIVNHWFIRHGESGNILLWVSSILFLQS